MHKNTIPPSSPEGIPAHLTKLNPMERSVWMLATVEQFSVNDIGDITGLSTPEVEQVLASARRKVQPLPLSAALGWKRYAGWIRNAAAVLLALMMVVFGFKANRAVVPTEAQVASPVPENSGATRSLPVPLVASSIQPSRSTVINQPIPTAVPPVVSAPTERVTNAVVPEESIPVIPSVEPMATPVRDVAVLPLLPARGVPEVVSGHPPVVDLGKTQVVGSLLVTNLETKTLIRLREALTPRSLILPDEGLKISALMPSLFSSAEE